MVDRICVLAYDVTWSLGHFTSLLTFHSFPYNLQRHTMKTKELTYRPILKESEILYIIDIIRYSISSDRDNMTGNSGEITDRVAMGLGLLHKMSKQLAKHHFTLDNLDTLDTREAGRKTITDSDTPAETDTPTGTENIGSDGALAYKKYNLLGAGECTDAQIIQAIEYKLTHDMPITDEESKTYNKHMMNVL